MFNSSLYSFFACSPLSFFFFLYALTLYFTHLLYVFNSLSSSHGKHVRLGLLDRNITLVLYNPTPSFYNIAIYAVSFWHWISIIFRMILFLLQYVFMQLDITSFDFFSFAPTQGALDLFHSDLNSTFLPANKFDR